MGMMTNRIWSVITNDQLWSKLTLAMHARLTVQTENNPRALNQFRLQDEYKGHEISGRIRMNITVTF